MFDLECLKIWKRLFYLLIVMFLGATSAIAYGERTEMQSPVEKTGQEALIIELKSTSGDSEELAGMVRVTQRATGVVIKPALRGLKPGLHGLHLHENASCQSGQSEPNDTASASSEPAKEAGEHWDPGITGNHAGPWRHGHRGDLPNLYVNPDGEAITPVYAPRVSSGDFDNRALVLHSQRDNYSDEPDSSGGSGDTVACGVAGGG